MAENIPYSQLVLSFDGGSPQSPALANHKRNIFRPVQYLGSKLRALEPITAIARELVPADSRVVDLFSGTSVVSQTLASLGSPVLACDAQVSCHVMGAAMLGVDRKKSEDIHEKVLLSIADGIERTYFYSHWTTEVVREDAALAQRNPNLLRQIDLNLPLVWRSGPKNELIHRLASAEGESALGIAPLFACTMAGTYFGIRQALAIDTIRHRIADAEETRRISVWQRNLLLTALMSAMSKSVFSAGKHFAQPLSAGQPNRPFPLSRLVQDRSVKISDEFIRAATMICQTARDGAEGHLSICAPVRTIYPELKNLRPTFVYADPPYTAQQYSRFYHALDTLVTYRVPALLHGDRVTNGLYPVDRFKSEFCSKKAAPSAFRSLLSAVYESGASLLLSYSTSHHRSTGNARMIPLSALVDACGSIFRKSRVEVGSLTHSYRQFNAQPLSNESRSDPELLIVCRR